MANTAKPVAGARVVPAKESAATSTSNVQDLDFLYEGSEKAEIISIGDEALQKVNGVEYLRCEVRYTAGKLAGKTFFANRTLGEDKAPIEVGMPVRVYFRFAKKKAEFVKEGEANPILMFGEISTSTVDNPQEMLDLLIGA